MNDSAGFLTRCFQWVVLAFIIGAFLDRAIPQGMFFDGVTYASIARNLAEGKGSLWDLHFRGDGPFTEHPPLHMGLQSLFFRVLGDQYYTESVFCLFILLFTIWAIIQLWKLIPESSTRQGWVLALLCWGTIPTVIWAYPNNLLDASMALFDLGSVYFLILAMRASRQRSRSTYSVLAGLFLFAATLTKGPVGLFPLASPFLFALFVSRETMRRAISVTLIMVGSLVLAYFLLCLDPQARRRLGDYVDGQVLMALAGKREKVDSLLGRWDLLRELAVQLSPTLGLSLLVYLLGRWRDWRPQYSPLLRSYGLFFLSVGLSASLPMLASLKQRSFYLLPAFPYFGLAWGIYLLPYGQYLVSGKLITPWIRKVLVSVGVLSGLFLVSYLDSKRGQIGRDEAMIREIQSLPQWLPLDQKIGICQGMESDYQFLSYAQRYIGLETRADYHLAEYILLDRSQCRGAFSSCLPKLGFEQVPSSLPSYDLYRKTQKGLASSRPVTTR